MINACLPAGFPRAEIHFSGPLNNSFLRFASKSDFYHCTIKIIVPHLLTSKVPGSVHMLHMLTVCVMPRCGISYTTQCLYHTVKCTKTNLHSAVGCQQIRGLAVKFSKSSPIHLQFTRILCTYRRCPDPRGSLQCSTRPPSWIIRESWNRTTEGTRQGTGKGEKVKKRKGKGEGGRIGRRVTEEGWEEKQ